MRLFKIIKRKQLTFILAVKSSPCSIVLLKKNPGGFELAVYGYVSQYCIEFFFRVLSVPLLQLFSFRAPSVWHVLRRCVSRWRQVTRAWMDGIGYAPPRTISHRRRTCLHAPRPPRYPARKIIQKLVTYKTSLKSHV